MRSVTDAPKVRAPNSAYQSLERSCRPIGRAVFGDSPCQPESPPPCHRRFLGPVLGLGIQLTCALASSAAEDSSTVELTTLADRVRVEIDGALFTEYIFTGAMRPYLYPIVLADGTRLTRDFPMRETPGEDRDHPHHRSLWFSHSRMNGFDCWNEGTAGGPKPKGSIVHEALLEATSGPVGTIRARSRWVAPDGSVPCTDETTIRFRPAPDGGRLLDYEVTLHAPAEAALLIGDNKDGTMAIRIAQWLTLPHKIAGKDIPGEGHIVLSTGVRDQEAWGKRADWCDTFAAHAGRIYGLAIFDHPQNLRHPTWWMARDYGLVAANPFGQHDFEKLADQHAGDFTVPAGASLTLRYRFYFHRGDTATAKVAEQYRAYIAAP